MPAQSSLNFVFVLTKLRLTHASFKIFLKTKISFWFYFNEMLTLCFLGYLDFKLIIGYLSIKFSTVWLPLIADFYLSYKPCCDI